jgi:transcriptional regulator with XRE-family HTH domain
MPGRNQNQKWTRVQRTEQEAACWTLSLDGLTQTQIAETLGISQKTVSRRLANRADSLVLPLVEQQRKIETDRILQLINALTPHVTSMNLELPYVLPYLKAVETLHKLSGVAAPVKTELTVTVQDSQDAELAELIAMSTAQDQLTNVRSDLEADA